MLRYYNLYELFIYTPANKCIKTDQKDNYTYFLCKMQILTYNFQSAEDLETAITVYNRQDAIALQ
jgi:hypothetical protein